MKNILKKGSKFFLTALVILNSLMNTLPVHAEETTTDENDLDKIVELGNAEDVFPDLMPQSDGISLTDTTGTGSIYAIPDSEKTFTQTVSADSEVLSEINNDEETPFKVSLEIRAACVAENNVYARESGYSNAIENSAIIGTAPEFVYTDGLSVE